MAKSHTTWGYRGENGNTAKMSVRGITTSVAADTFRDFLENHTQAVVATQSFASRQVFEGEPDMGTNTDERLVCRYQELATGDIVRVTMVNPVEADMELVPGKDGGKRATAAFMALLGAALEAATGLEYRSLEGVYYCKK